jgi:hypothetical protein
MVHMLVVQFPRVLIHTGLLTKIMTETILTEYTTAPSARQEGTESNVKNDGKSTTSTRVG